MLQFEFLCSAIFFNVQKYSVLSDFVYLETALCKLHKDTIVYQGQTCQQLLHKQEGLCNLKDSFQDLS